jgi:two-component system, cell cycle response regulator
VDYWQLPVRDAMKPNVITYEEDTPIRTIYEFLCRVSIRCVVIVRGNRPTGSISRASLLRWFHNLVISKGLVEREYMQRFDAESPFRIKDHLIDTTQQLTHQADDLLRRFQNGDEDLMPCIVSRASGMQELIDDLLAYSRYVDFKRDISISSPSSLAEGICLE